jgi:hypothetical protein
VRADEPGAGAAPGGLGDASEARLVV